MWNYKLRKISVLSVFKFMLLYGIIIGAILGFLGGLFSFAVPRYMGYGVFGGLFIGVVYGVFMALFSAVGAWFFNIISGLIDGIDIEIEKKE